MALSYLLSIKHASENQGCLQSWCWVGFSFVVKFQVQFKFWISRPVIATNLLLIKLSKSYGKVAELHTYLSDSQITKLKCPSWYLGNWLILCQPISKISGNAPLPPFPPSLVPKPSPVILGVPK